MDTKEIVDAALKWRKEWPDVEDDMEMDSGCDCEVCSLMRACDNYINEQGG